MAQSTTHSPQTDDPIVIPLLQSDPFNLQLHDHIYQKMQSCVLGPTKNLGNNSTGTNNNQQIWSPARDIAQNNCGRNCQNGINTDASTSGLPAFNNIENFIHPHTFTNNNCASNNDVSEIAKNFIPKHCVGEKMSAIERLADYSRKLYNENAMDENYFEVRRPIT